MDEKSIFNRLVQEEEKLNELKVKTPKNLLEAGRKQIKIKLSDMIIYNLKKDYENLTKKDLNEEIFLTKNCTENYDILGYIKEGHYTSVYHGLDKRDETAIAIKLIPRFKVQRWKKTPKILEPLEITLLKKAQGVKGVVKFIEYIDMGNHLFLAMGLEDEKKDVITFLEENENIEEEVVRSIVKETVRIISECHEKGIKYEDMKPEKILINKKGEVAMLKFGQKIEYYAEYYSRFRKTMNFIPPENRFLTPTMNDSGIVWVLGLLTFVMLYGEYPFKENSEIIKAEFSFPPGVKISKKGKQFMQKCLQANPDARLTLETAAKHPFLTSNDF